MKTITVGAHYRVLDTKSLRESKADDSPAKQDLQDVEPSVILIAEARAQGAKDATTMLHMMRDSLFGGVEGLMAQSLPCEEAESGYWTFTTPTGKTVTMLDTEVEAVELATTG